MGGHGASKPTRWHTIDEIPDEMVPQSSLRDPENPLYRTRRWVNFKKKQILFQQRDGVSDYMRTRMARFSYYGLWASTIGCCVFNIYMFNKLTSGKK